MFVFQNMMTGGREVEDQADTTVEAQEAHTEVVVGEIEEEEEGATPDPTEEVCDLLYLTYTGLTLP